MGFTATLLVPRLLNTFVVLTRCLRKWRNWLLKWHRMLLSGLQRRVRGASCDEVAGRGGASDCCTDAILAAGIFCIGSTKAPCIMTGGINSNVPTVALTDEASTDGGTFVTSSPDDSTFSPSSGSPAPPMFGSTSPGTSTFRYVSGAVLAFLYWQAR